MWSTIKQLEYNKKNTIVQQHAWAEQVDNSNGIISQYEDKQFQPQIGDKEGREED